MAHESFEDDATAAVMNELFVNIKVDREERPDIDQIYMNALHHPGRAGRLAADHVPDADGRAVLGRHLFPERHRATAGRPSPMCCARCRGCFATSRDKIEQNRDALMARLADKARPAGKVVIGCSELDGVGAAARRRVRSDAMAACAARRNFRNRRCCELLWRAGLRTGDERFFEAVEHTLERICEGGIYDHLGGGFSRYSVDERWLVPHFEKMLYDNAQLLELLALA